MRLVGGTKSEVIVVLGYFWLLRVILKGTTEPDFFGYAKRRWNVNDVLRLFALLHIS